MAHTNKAATAPEIAPATRAAKIPTGVIRTFKYRKSISENRIFFVILPHNIYENHSFINHYDSQFYKK